MDNAVAALAQFNEQMQKLGTTHYRAVATSAVREAKNGGDFVERIKHEVGLDLDSFEVLHVPLPTSSTRRRDPVSPAR